MKKRLSSVCNNDENTAKILNALNLFNRAEKCCEDNSNNVKKDYRRKILSDIIVNNLTEHQAKLACMYYFGNINVVEIARLLGINRSSVSRGLRLANKKIADNIQSYSVECIHIIDVTNEPESVGDIAMVFKISDNSEENTEGIVPKKCRAGAEPYKEMLVQYEKTINVIKKQIRKLANEVQNLPLRNIERGEIIRRKELLEDELCDLYKSAAQIRKYIE